MAKVKIKVAKSIEEIKRIHAFVTNKYLTSSAEHKEEEEFPLADTYSAMIDLMSKYPKFQIYAEIDKKIVGCAVALEPDGEEKTVWLRTICVEPEYRNKGLSTYLLSILEKNIKKAGFCKVLTECRERANGFFFREGYVPYLYVSTIDSENITLIREGNINNFPIIEEYQAGRSYYFKFDVGGEMVYEEHSHFWKLNPGKIKVEYVFEKDLV